jgi:diacylglycerol kinase (ATP)
MGPIKIILNPTAGRGYGAKAEPELRRQLALEGLQYELVFTEAPWHAVELAREAAGSGFEIVVAAGGDGTTHEVANGLMAAAEEGHTGPSLGIIPIGSGSDFAHTVGVPADMAGACRRLAQGQTRVVDAGRVTLPGPNEHSRYFDNTVNVGFGGVVTVEARKIRRLRGIPLYLLAVLKTVFLYHHAPLVTISYDDQERTLPSLMICVANGPREGGGFLVAPQAQPDDGLFDLCVTSEVSQLQMLGLIPYFMKGTHVGRKPVSMARAKQVVISSPDDLIAHVDGEILCTDSHRIELELLPQRLRVWC